MSILIEQIHNCTSEVRSISSVETVVSSAETVPYAYDDEGNERAPSLSASTISLDSDVDEEAFDDAG